MVSIIIEQITIPFSMELLDSWKQREPNIILTFILEWN